jgi:hypothetical protein
VKSASSTAAIAAAKFILLNHVPLSQMAMVVAGLASSGAASSPPSIEASSVVTGCIPLVTNDALLLHNIVKFVAFLRRKWCRRREQADARCSGRDSFY